MPNYFCYEMELCVLLMLGDVTLSGNMTENDGARCQSCIDLRNEVNQYSALPVYVFLTITVKIKWQFIGWASSLCFYVF